MSKKRQINAVAFHFTKSLEDKIPEIKTGCVDVPEVVGEKKEYKPVFDSHIISDIQKKIDENQLWLQTLGKLNPGERIITEITRKNESVCIVVDELGRYKRLL